MKLIIGVKGTGKTKALIEMVNNAADASKGDVVCIEKGGKLNYDIKYKVRLVDTEKFDIDDADALYGFIAGISASNHDITDLFVDSALKICRNDVEAFVKFAEKVDAIAEKQEFNLVMTSSLPIEECPETLKKYL